MNKYLLAGYRLFGGSPTSDSDEEMAGQQLKHKPTELDEDAYMEEICAGLIFSHTPDIPAKKVANQRHHA